MKNEIKVSWDRRSGWRATVHVPASMAMAPGVYGQGHSFGPWMEGFGDTPEGAISALCTAVGRAFVASAVIEEGEPCDSE